MSLKCETCDRAPDCLVVEYARVETDSQEWDPCAEIELVPAEAWFACRRCADAMKANMEGYRRVDSNGRIEMKSTGRLLLELENVDLPPIDGSALPDDAWYADLAYSHGLEVHPLDDGWGDVIVRHWLRFVRPGGVIDRHALAMLFASCVGHDGRRDHVDYKPDFVAKSWHWETRYRRRSTTSRPQDKARTGRREQ